MILSTAGGELKEYFTYDHAKVEVKDSICWYISPFKRKRQNCQPSKVTALVERMTSRHTVSIVEWAFELGLGNCECESEY